VTGVPAAVAYLEHGEYDAHGWRRAITLPLVELRGDFDVDIFSNFDDQHDRWCKNADSLCSGDGYRWNPAAPTLRFR
jgi:hypothetical protein